LVSAPSREETLRFILQTLARLRVWRLVGWRRRPHWDSEEILRGVRDFALETLGMLDSADLELEAVLWDLYESSQLDPGNAATDLEALREALTPEGGREDEDRYMDETALGLLGAIGAASQESTSLRVAATTQGATLLDNMVAVLVEAVRHPEELEMHLLQFDALAEEVPAGFDYYQYAYATLFEAVGDLAVYDLTVDEVIDRTKYIGGRLAAMAHIRYALNALRAAGVEMPEDV
jgi:hypothetical protein